MVSRNERYARQTMLPEIGEEGQRRLAASSVLIVGLGGLGSAVAPCLAGAGVGRLGLADPDRVSASNLPRQTLYTESQLGRPKPEAARERLAALSSSTRFDLYPEGLTAANARELVAACDLVVDCCDNFATRYLLDETCAAVGRPWVYGSIGAFHGQVSLFNGPGGRRYTDLYPDREALCALPPAASGVIGPTPGVIGALEAAEAIKWLVGFGEPLDGRLLTLDLKTMQTETIEF